MSNQKGFTLVELLTVIVIIGIAGGLLYTVFFMNWQAFDTNIAQADLGAELQEIVESIANDGRLAQQINVGVTGLTQQALFLDTNGAVIVRYTMRSDGQLILNRNQAVSKVLTRKLDFVNSRFYKENGNTLQMTIALRDNVLGRPVRLVSSNEIYPRN